MFGEKYERVQWTHISALDNGEFKIYIKDSNLELCVREYTKYDHCTNGNVEQAPGTKGAYNIMSRGWWNVSLANVKAKNGVVRSMTLLENVSPN